MNPLSDGYEPPAYTIMLLLLGDGSGTRTRTIAGYEPAELPLLYPAINPWKCASLRGIQGTPTRRGIIILVS